MIGTTSTGSVLGTRYVLDRRLATGGMGQVWQATDRVLDRPVAVKMLRPDLVDSSEFRTRFRSEARLAAGLSHPGIAHVYDYVEDLHDDQCPAYLVMELIDGEPLAQLLRRDGPVDLGVVVSTLDQTADALGAAHRLGIVHRDIKPGNLMITADGRVKVTDFGIARAIETAGVTEVGQVIGTVNYMSPEQATGEEVTAASDVYSLAVVAHEMLSGHAPFTGGNPAAIALAHVQSDPPPLPPTVPAGLRTLIERSLGKHPATRPCDGAEFAAELRRLALEMTPPHLARNGPQQVTPTARAAQPSAALASTAVAEQPATRFLHGARTGEEDATTMAVAGDRRPPASLLGVGWTADRRRRRRLAGWGALALVVACVVAAIAGTRGDDVDTTAATSIPDATVAAPAVGGAAVDVVTVDRAALLGLTEDDARAVLTAAGLTATTTSGPSAGDVAGLVIDVQPSGPMARGSNVTIVLGDGAVAPETVPQVDGPNNGKGKDKSNGKAKGKNGG